MVTISITQAAFEAIAATLPDEAWGLRLAPGGFRAALLFGM
jgi:hypothetical protein